MVNKGARIIVLSDRHSNSDLAPIPSLLLTGAVHHHMVREKLRTQAGLIIEAGDVREVHHVALLIGYGATAVNPYLVLESAEDLAREKVFVTDVEPSKALRNVAYGLGKGVLKVMSKIGVSTVASYTGAQIFEAIGLSHDVVDAYFTGTSSKSAAPGSTSSPKRSAPATSRRTRPAGSTVRAVSSMSAASTSGAVKAPSTCSTPRRCSVCSTPPEPARTTSSSSTRHGSTTSPSVC
ncbi:glutamate synthase central domain-containing protein [Aeromicrobium sp. UC242_57]|uniref:glutamate synthase central domain-containing protein n=1 Tax=Aeromicrobium sp. UC242_57 TaxID=3374624 RepID=UPI003795D24E